MKVIILSQATRHPDYAQVDRASKTTWAAKEYENVKILHYYGSKDIDGNLIDPDVDPPKDGCVETNGELICDAIDFLGRDVDERSRKQVLAFKYCLENYEFDYIYKIGVTSYVDVEKLYNTLLTLPRERLYEGSGNAVFENDDDEDWEGIHFIAGYNVILSKDVVEMVVKHMNDYISIPHVEDVALGQLIIYDLKIRAWDERIYLVCGHIHSSNPAEKMEKFDTPTMFNYKFHGGNCWRNYLRLHDEFKKAESS